MREGMEAHKRAQEEAQLDAYSRAAKLEAEVAAYAGGGRLRWLSSGDGAPSAGSKAAAVAPVASEDTETSALVSASRAAENGTAERPRLHLVDSERRSVHWAHSVLEATWGCDQELEGDKEGAVEGARLGTMGARAGGRATPRSSCPRLSLAQKARLHAARPDLAIVPDWVARYRMSQVPGIDMPDSCVLVATVGATFLIVGLLMLLWLRRKHHELEAHFPPHPYADERRGHTDR